MDNTFKLLTFDCGDFPEYTEGGFFSKKFGIKMFAMNEMGKTACIIVNNYSPFFYVKVGDDWDENDRAEFIGQICQDVPDDAIEDNILSSKIVRKKKLYGFDGGKEYNFVQIFFKTEQMMKKASNLWYDINTSNNDYSKKIKPDGYCFNGEYTTIYESNIPSLIRMFHITEISPSGWIELPPKKTKYLKIKKTSCDYEMCIDYSDIISLPHKETIAPFKICSFDIEASSSHGDFPLPIKNHKKLVTNIIDTCKEFNNYDTAFVSSIIYYAFGFNMIHADALNNNQDTKHLANIDKVYPMRATTYLEISECIKSWLLPYNQHTRSYELPDDVVMSDPTIGYDGDNDLSNDLDNDLSNDLSNDAGNDAENDVAGDIAETQSASNWFKKRMYVNRHNAIIKKCKNVIDVVTNSEYSRDDKITELTQTMNGIFPKLQGDNVTFIGSTFLRNGEKNPYMNHCIAKNTCDNIDGAIIETYSTEKEVLLAWSELIRKEDPDIIIGYNIFGFDCEFMYLRARELNCDKDFLQLSRIKGQICVKKDWKTGKESIETSTLVVASGQHDLKFFGMTGRLSIDMFNYFRREFPLPQYKLDYVSGHFIGDYIKKYDHINKDEIINKDETINKDATKIYSKNLTGLYNGCFVCFEEESHSVDKYKNGKKFEVYGVDYTQGTFIIDGLESPDIDAKKVRWGLAKDDITPQDIFKMTNEGSKERSIIAKYCIQDCNLVQHLLRKIDVITEYGEMSTLCSVPIHFLVMRGQSIKLTSYIAKKCREKNTLMPTISKSDDDEGYEGATVLDPKCGLYMDTPIACLDYGSLYPSSMISENISHDSKVWCREYDLNNNLLKETGVVDEDTGLMVYDNLPGYTYVDITSNVYKWQHKNPDNLKSAMEKTHVGYKTCRWAQFPDNPETGKPMRAVMPSILEELLLARKNTRKLMESHPDEFMRNILNKRQLSIKVTANSLYGQTGAKTSSFYEKDCASSTTAIGRKLLMYGKRVVEEVFANKIVPTTSVSDYKEVLTNAECIYGDTDSVFFRFNLKTVAGLPIIGKNALVITIELAQMVGKLASAFLKKPHDLEYEKTFLPFCLLSKKRYVGMLYEYNPTSCKRKSMGIVLKRRDNAHIVKDIYGGIIDLLMNGNNIEKSVKFLKEHLQQMVDGNCSMDKLVVSKALRSGYKNPNTIAHKVLADRIGRRDPGNKPNTGDRIPYAYIHNNAKGALQGERIEHPDYIRTQRLQLNYSFYITNQIMKPVQQLFALVLEQLPAFQKKKGQFEIDIWTATAHIEDEVKREKKITEMRHKEVKSLLFDEFLVKADNLNKGNRAITEWFGSAVVRK